MHNSRAVPMEGARQSVNQMTWHPAPLQLRGEEQSGWPRTYDQHARLIGIANAGKLFFGLLDVCHLALTCAQA